MLLRRPLRRWLSSCLVLAVLFTQLATAAYACPMLNGMLEQAAASSDEATMPCAAMMSGGAGAMLDADQPGLCLQHCQAGSQTVDQANPSSVTAPVLLSVLTVRASDSADLHRPAWSAHQRSRASAPPLPHSIDHCCYRL